MNDATFSYLHREDYSSWCSFDQEFEFVLKSAFVIWKFLIQLVASFVIHLRSIDFFRRGVFRYCYRCDFCSQKCQASRSTDDFA